MRGTDDLTPEQRPRFGRKKRKMRGRTQPYRRRRNRVPGATLDAILKGQPTFLANPHDFARERMKFARKAMKR